jgi:UTP:GlnB (protein PII) uridylyltransferase
MILLAYKARYGLREPINSKLMLSLGEIEKHFQSDFAELSLDFDFLKSVRDIYRLTVSADDELQPEYLDEPGKILGFGKADGTGAAEQLMSAYQESTTRVAKIVQKLITALEV